MAKIHCLVIIRPGETPDVFRARIQMAVTSVLRSNSTSGTQVAATSLTHLGVRLDPRWLARDADLPGEVCYVASLNRAEASLAFIPIDVVQAASVPRNPEGCRLQFEYRALDARHRDRTGTSCEIVSLIEQPSGDIGYDKLPMLRVRFTDGFELAVQPNEAATASAACAAAKAYLLACAQRRNEMLMDPA